LNSIGGLLVHEGESVESPTKKAIQDDDFELVVTDMSVLGSENLLIENDNVIHDIEYLDLDTISWLPIQLTKLLQGNLCADHRGYWWFTHDWARSYNQKNELFPEGLLDNLELIIRLLTSSRLDVTSSEEEVADQILRESTTLATYLSYPTLEGFVKVACSRDIKLNGEIKQGRKIRKLSDSKSPQYRHYNDSKDVCSNIGTLLWHLETEIVQPRHRSLFKNMRKAVGEIYDHPPGYVYGLFNDQRNHSLHGRNRAPKDYGILLNYICLVIWTTLL